MIERKAEMHLMVLAALKICMISLLFFPHLHHHPQSYKSLHHRVYSHTPGPPLENISESEGQTHLINCQEIIQLSIQTTLDIFWYLDARRRDDDMTFSSAILFLSQALKRLQLAASPVAPTLHTREKKNQGSINSFIWSSFFCGGGLSSYKMVKYC